MQPLRLPPDWEPWGSHPFIKVSFCISLGLILYFSCSHFEFILVPFCMSVGVHGRRL